jgi:hypothetical protein
MSVRFIKIDDLIRGDHYFLDREDECYYLLEYFAGKGFGIGGANQLIANLKKKPSQKTQPHYRYKRIAINTIIGYLKSVLPEDFLEGVTLVPMPPSKSKDDDEYDDRMVQILQGVCIDTECDLRELIILRESIKASHKSADRPRPNQLQNYFELDEDICDPAPQTIIIVDDMITTGSHFKACKNLLLNRYPNARIVGVFITRRVIVNDEILDF